MEQPVLVAVVVVNDVSVVVAALVKVPVMELGDSDDNGGDGDDRGGDDRGDSSSCGGPTTATRTTISIAIAISISIVYVSWPHRR